MLIESNIAALRRHYLSDNFLAFSVDVDWASEACIRDITSFFLAREVPLTIFCTHPSPAIDALRGDPRVELGIHPNPAPHSTQGGTLDEVLAYCRRLAPNARCLRAHRWYSSNDLYDRLVGRGFTYDSNECALLDDVQPYLHRSGLLRLPVFFEDGGFLQAGGEPDFARCGKKQFDAPGLKVLDLHPIHFSVNSPTLGYYRSITARYTPQQYGALTQRELARLAYPGAGMRTYLEALLCFARRAHIQIVPLGQPADRLIIERS